jgi:hypothetical protein
MPMMSHDPGESVYDWLRRNFEATLTGLRGSSRVSLSPKVGGVVAIDVLTGGGGSDIRRFPAVLTGFRKMKVATPTIVGTRLLDHPHRYWYAFTEAEVEMECMDGRGNILKDQTECEGKMPRTVTSTGNTDLRIGDLDWLEVEDDGDVDADKKPAINLAEIHHQLPPLLSDGTFLTDTSEPWFIYGVDIHTAWYGAGVNPQPPTANGAGKWAYFQTVLMYERTDVDGDVVRFFNCPGLHLGECS